MTDLQTQSIAARERDNAIDLEQRDHEMHREKQARGEIDDV